ncbi:hypothetical protein GCM10027174_22840 [Salinifilum aidingensis]
MWGWSDGVAREGGDGVHERPSGVVFTRVCTGFAGRCGRGYGVAGAAGPDEKVGGRGARGCSGPARYPCTGGSSRRPAGGRSDWGEWSVLGAVLLFVALTTALLGFFGGVGVLDAEGRPEVVSAR